MKTPKVSFTVRGEDWPTGERAPMRALIYFNLALDMSVRVARCLCARRTSAAVYYGRNNE